MQIAEKGLNSLHFNWLIMRCSAGVEMLLEKASVSPPSITVSHPSEGPPPTHPKSKSDYEPRKGQVVYNSLVMVRTGLEE